MYLDCRVKIPTEGGKITVKTIGGTPYVYLETGREYIRDKKYNTPKRICIGKRDKEHQSFMYPNEKFLKYFPRDILPLKKEGTRRSGCLHIGAYLVIRKIVSEYHLDQMLAEIIGKDAGLFIDLAAYTDNCQSLSNTVIQICNTHVLKKEYPFVSPLCSQKVIRTLSLHRRPDTSRRSPKP